MQRYPIMLAICANCFIISPAQNTSLERPEIEEMFAASQQIDWFSTFSGTIDDVHPVDMAMACAGPVCKGRYILAESGLSFDLEGYTENGSTTLDEIDNNGHVSGHLSVNLTRDACDGEWWSVRLDRTVNVHLVSNRIVHLKIFRANMYVVNGTLGNKPANVILTKETPQVISVTVITEGSLMRGVGECTDKACSSSSTILSSSDGAYYTIEVQEKSADRWAFSIAGAEGAPTLGGGSVQDVFPMTQRALNGYRLLVDCAYPKTGNTAFDNWVEGQFNSWIETCTGNLPETGEQELQPADRWASRAYAWIDLHLLNAQLASGIITTYQPGTERYDRQGFIFDLVKGVLVAPDELARRDLNISAMLAEKGNAQWLREKHNNEDGEAPDPNMRHISMCATGFIIHSDFDPVYGDVAVIVPYREVEGSLRRNVLTNSVLQ